MEVARTPWKRKGLPGSSKTPFGAGLTSKKWLGPLEAAAILGRGRGPLGNSSDPLKASETPWEQQGPLVNDRDHLEATANSWK